MNFLDQIPTADWITRLGWTLLHSLWEIALVAAVLAPWMPWCVVAWFVGVFAVSLWNLGGWIAAQRLKRLGTNPVAEELSRRLSTLAQRSGINRSVAVVKSLMVEVPVVVGWLRPMILLPAGILTGLTPAELDAVLAHELAHIRRHDYLVNLLQTVIETLFFYHPGVWWLSRQIRVAREHCCDDAAVALCGNKVDYASALAAVEAGRAAPKMAMAARKTDNSTLGRIRRVLGLAGQAPRRWGRSLAGGLVASAIVVALVTCFVVAGDAAQEMKKLTATAEMAVDEIENETARGDVEAPRPSIVAKVASKPTRNTRVIYDDEAFRFLGRHYGDHRDPGGNTEPGLFVHSKKHDKWLQLMEVSTKGGSFGSSRSNNPEDQKKLNKISVGWDFSALETQAYSGMPLQTSGSLVFPDKIEWDDKRQRYSLGFMTDLGIPSASTLLFIELADLEAAFKKPGVHDNRAGLLRKNAEKFEFWLEYHGEEDKPYLSLLLEGPTTPPRGPLPVGWTEARLSKDQVLKLIEHLRTEGFLKNAVNIAGKGVDRPKGPAYTLTVGCPSLRGPENSKLHEVLGWDLEMIQRLDAMAAVLDGDAAQEMKELLNRLAWNRKEWETPEVDLATLRERSATSHDAFWEILKLRKTGTADAVPVLADISSDNRESGRIHGYAAEQALFCIGTPEALKVLDRRLLGNDYDMDKGFGYTHSWKMPEPQRSRFIEQYILRDLSKDLTVEVKASPVADEKGRIDFTVTMKNVSREAFQVRDRQVYQGELLFLRSTDGPFAKRLVYRRYDPLSPKWITLEPGGTHRYKITARLKATFSDPYFRRVSDATHVLDTGEMIFDIDEPGEFEVFAAVQDLPMTDEWAQENALSNPWVGRAVSKPIQIELGATDIIGQQPTTPEELPWGEAIEGVTTRLQAGEFRDGYQWLSCDVRNDSSDLSVQLGPNGRPNEIIIDDHVYGWGIGVAGSMPFCKPGQQNRCEFKLDENWMPTKMISGPDMLKLKPGKHTVRAAVYATGKDENGGDREVRVLSNPVEIEITPDLPDGVGEKAAWGEAVDGVQCAVRPITASFAPGDGIVVDVMYRNVSDEPVTVCVCPDPLYTWIHVSVKTAEGWNVMAGAHGTGTRPPLKLADFVTLKPMQTASFRQVIASPKDPEQWPKPGKYYIHAEINKINRMDKHCLGFAELCKKHGLTPWVAGIESGVATVLIAEDKPLMIDVLFADGNEHKTPSFWIDYEQLGEKDLRKRMTQLLKASPDLEVVIRADRTVPHEHVARLLNWLKADDVENVSLTVSALGPILALSPGEGRDGTVRGKVIGAEGDAKSVEYSVTLDHEEWTNRLGELPNLVVTAGETFEFRNVPAGKCKVRASRVGEPGISAGLHQLE